MNLETIQPKYYPNECNHMMASTRTKRWLVALLLVIVCGPLATAQAQEASEEKKMEAAWEFRPYKVLVWLVHNDSWRVRGVEEKLMSQLGQRAIVADRSGWNVTVERAPNPWNWRLLDENFNQELYSDDLQAEILNALGATQGTDKLMVVRVNDENGMFDTSVQEFDLKTKVWGAAVKRVVNLQSLDTVLFNSIETAFMPVTRIENVHNSDVRCRVRGIGIAIYAERDENGEWKMVENEDSPVWVNNTEVLMPVILRKDRKGNMESIKIVDWTFLAIEERSGPSLNCTTHSMRRAPLGQRTGGRTERLALCVRAPDRETTIRLISNDTEQVALPDLEVYSRRPDQEKGTENELLGKTDWRGQITIPPNEDPIRILLVKSGRRPLARVPVIPGLFSFQQTAMPNDEQRLYAEGITRGLFNELMDNVARRQLLAERIRIALERDNLDQADQFLKEMRDEVPDSQEFTYKLNDEKTALMNSAKDKRQKDFIDGYFIQLQNAASEFLNKTGEMELTQKIQEVKRN